MGRLCVYASELGALTGTIPGKKATSAAVVERLWKAHSPESHYAALMRSCGKGVDGEARRQELMERFGNALVENEAIAKLVEKKDVLGAEAILKKQVTEAVQKANLSRADAEKLERSVLARVSGDYGHRNEDLVRKKHAEKKKVHISDGNDTFRWRKLPFAIAELGERAPEVGGRFDGVVQENGRLVEYKTRKAGAKKDIGLHELAQLHAYMYIGDCREIDLVQCEFKKEEPKNEETSAKKGKKTKKETKERQVLDERTIEWDDEIWRLLTEALENFFRCYARLLADEQLQLQFVCCEDEYERETLFFGS